ncbi:hypothetical protein ASG01_06480 [Chryseobacterium sp. Leaf180]|uniref:glycosyltransferase family A protein n=1 Tax=Chryseobacterium sp. Leaf180 TaxID=1736289 RepID=UPI0006FBD192|nr:glycosyltransferase family 2 protein [Chryseobacterium sp. Leaf180]KQR95486.1 hypothetical protein ASG01_06480 [Chryseobacterium sp. Leaf180]
MKKNKLAIIIPYYKTDFFEETVKSVSAQTNKNFTLYIGNDASPHDPLPIILKYFKKEEFNYYNYSDNLGGKNLALQWERILENVSEEWFQILGDDDMISENFVEEFYLQLPELTGKNLNILKFRFDWVDENNNLLKINDYGKKFFFAHEILEKKYRLQMNNSLSENIFRNSVFRKYKFEKIPLAWGSDDLALLKFSERKQIIFCSNAKVIIRIYHNSISGSSEKGVEKSNAFNIYREKLIMDYSSYFSQTFIKSVLDDYLSWCHYKSKSVNWHVIFFLIINLKIFDALKTAKKIFYIKRKQSFIK